MQGYPILAAYLNYLLFDQQMVVYDAGFVQVSGAGNFANELLSVEDILVSKPGTAYIYVTNESANGVVYFDDLSVVHSEGPVVQGEDYYPFGLSFNAFRRATAKRNKLHTFQEQERITALDLNWIQFKYRNHDPFIGRFFNIGNLKNHSWGCTDVCHHLAGARVVFRLVVTSEVEAELHGMA